ncbi:MAG: hypothetical protein ACMUEM_01555 [Flavobacteriales bacterium AspAUS03]
MEKQAKTSINIEVTTINTSKNYPPILKPGTKMVYATCSIWPSENERQVKIFLAS